MVAIATTTVVYELNDYSLDAIIEGQRPLAKPDAHQVQIRVAATSLNYRDLLMAKGLYSRRLSLPLVLLSDGAGEVVEVGSSVTKFKSGDRVCVNFMSGWIKGPLDKSAADTALGGAIDGMHRQYANFNEESLVKIPDHMSLEEAATLPCAALTAWNGLVRQGQVKAGETVLTMGTGGVSIFALQIAKLHGARVIATSSSDKKLERLRTLGADELINYKTTPNWDKKVLELTGGKGVDHVVEVGGAGTLEKSMNAVRIGGHISMIGVLSGPAQFSLFPVLMKNIKIQGIFVGSVEMFEEMNRAFSLHRTKPVIDKVFNAGELKESLQYLESGSHFGKIVLKF